MKLPGDLLARDFMTRDVIAVSPDDSVQKVADTLLSRDIHGVPVIDENDKVLGIITETDFFVKDQVAIHLPSFANILEKTVLARTLEKEDKRSLLAVLNAKARDIMTADCITIDESAPFDEIINIFAEKRIKTLPVVSDKNTLVGIISLVDTLPYVQKLFKKK